MRFMIGQTKVARRRVAGIVLAVVSLALVGIAVAAPPPPPPPASMTLNTPASDAVITQNDPSTASLGCSLDAIRGYGFVIDFSWTRPQLKGLKHFRLVLQRTGATGGPVLDVTVGAATTSYRFLQCNAFVIDSNLSGWLWQVTGLNGAKNVIALGGPRSLSFDVCRLDPNGTTACHT